MDTTKVNENLLENIFTTIPDEGITDQFRAKIGLTEDDVIADLNRIGSLLTGLGIPHLFLAGFNTGSKTEITTHRHTIGTSSVLELMIEAVCISNPDYETFFIALGKKLQEMATSGDMEGKRLLHKGNYTAFLQGMQVPDVLFGKFIDPKTPESRTNE
jgi:hypothetical protein